MARKALLVCGIVSSLFYVAMNVFLAMQWESYSSASQTVSELSAIGTPTRVRWAPLGITYTLLVAAFGWGVWLSARRKRLLRIVAVLIVASGIIGLGWPPMHQRAVLAAGGGTLTDTMHILWSMVTVILFMLEIGFAAAAFGKRFRLYSVATMAIVVVSGALTGLDASRIGANLPTPWVGVWDRSSIAVFLLWIAVLVFVFLCARDAAVESPYQYHDRWIAVR